MKTSSTSASKGAVAFLLCFAAVIIVGVALGEWYCRAAVVSWHIEAQRVANIYVATTDNAIIGDSQMYDGFAQSPAIAVDNGSVKPYEMLAISGESGLMMDILVEQYFKFRKPGRVIVPAGPQVFAENRIARSDGHMESYFKQNNVVQHDLGVMSYFFEPGISNFMLEAFERIALFRLRRWLHAQQLAERHSGPRARLQWRNLILVADREMTLTQCINPIQPNWTMYTSQCRELMARARAGQQRPAVDFQKTENFLAFQRMVSFLHRKGAQICFVRTPLPPEMLTQVEHDPQYLKAITELKEMAGRAQARYVDFRQLPVAITPALFADSDHLTEKGSQLFVPAALRACYGPEAAPAPSESDVTQDTTVGNLPQPLGTGFSWTGVRGLTVETISGTPTMPGQPILRLYATPNDTGHSLIARFRGLHKNETYRITALVKSVAGANVELAAYDQPDGDPVHSASVFFSPSGQSIVGSTGAAAQGIERGPGDWEKIWIDLTTTDGQFAVALRPAVGDSNSFKGDGKMGLLLGGLEVTPSGG
ncbi:MAG TPA: hypothetical protein VHV26_07515 [Rhizomicrobium sp.]|jgi:hypothetical protein|nr:hypothetical protein [Rhizomicrobium sp.]